MPTHGRCAFSTITHLQAGKGLNLDLWCPAQHWSGGREGNAAMKYQQGAFATSMLEIHLKERGWNTETGK